MKLFTRTILTWILSLSLTGLPVVAQAQDMSNQDMTSADHSAKNMTVSTNVSDNTESCHSKNKNMAQANMNASPAALDHHAIQAQSVVKNSSMDGSCCGDDCQCNSDMSCQSAHHSGASAILQSTLFTSSPLNSHLATESIVLYHDCDADSEVIPPIA